MLRARHGLIVFAGALALLAGPVAGALTLTTSSDSYVGKIVDAIPPNDDLEPKYINSLIQLAPGAGPVACALATTEQCDRLGSPAALTGPFPQAVYVNRDGSGSATTTLPGTFSYILAKYGNNGSYVWYSSAGFSGEISVQSKFCGTPGADCPGVSHISYFNRGGGGGFPMPEPGTLALLGLGLIGLGAARRKS